MKTKLKANGSAVKTRRILAPSEARSAQAPSNGPSQLNSAAADRAAIKSTGGTRPADGDSAQVELARAKLLAASNAKKARLRHAAAMAQKTNIAAAAVKARQLKAARARQAAKAAAVTGAADASKHTAAVTEHRPEPKPAMAASVKPQARQPEAHSASTKQNKPQEGETNQNQRAPDSRSKPEAPPEEKKAPPIIKATALLAAKYPNIVEDTNDNRSKSETRIVFVVAFIIGLIIAAGWISWDSINFQSEGDFVYNSGLVGGIMMAVILTYALRKRVKKLRKAGNMEAWYYFHLIGGVLGPLIIVFHTSFTIKSTNSAVALFTMITVVFSGLFGRYIYTRIGYNLHRKLLAIKDSEQGLLEKLRDHQSPLSDKIERRLSNFALASLTGSRSLLRLPMRLLSIHTSAMGCYVKVGLDLTSMIKSQARREGWRNSDTKSRIAVEKDQLRKYINAIAEIANIHLLERVLVMWRILHIPLLYILVITSLAHVLAVHMY